MSTLFRIDNNDFGYNFGLHIAQKNEDGQKFLAKPLEFEESPTPTIGLPVLTLSLEDITKLMDELWSLGIRPTQYGREGELGAMKAHLEDMRRLVFEESKQYYYKY